ncbi:MAG: hypothetical protein KBI40_07140, partial [Firmicutes bacterium]|nr:hypothetical protein [Candidatus Fermentithermobacillaceae bacterium]
KARPKLWTSREAREYSYVLKRRMREGYLVVHKKREVQSIGLRTQTPNLCGTGVMNTWLKKRLDSQATHIWAQNALA